MNYQRPPTQGEYRQSFDAYVAAVSVMGGCVFRVEESDNGLLTWAVELPGVHRDDAIPRLEQCYSDHFKDTELAYVRSVLRSEGSSDSNDDDADER